MKFCLKLYKISGHKKRTASDFAATSTVIRLLKLWHLTDKKLSNKQCREK